MKNIPGFTAEFTVNSTEHHWRRTPVRAEAWLAIRPAQGLTEMGLICDLVAQQAFDECFYSRRLTYKEAAAQAQLCSAQAESARTFCAVQLSR